MATQTATVLKTTVGKLSKSLKKAVFNATDNGEFDKFRNIRVEVTETAKFHGDPCGGGSYTFYHYLVCFPDGHVSVTNVGCLNGCQDLSIKDGETGVAIYVEYDTFQGVDMAPTLMIHPDHLTVLVGIHPEEFGETKTDGMPWNALCDYVAEKLGKPKEAKMLATILGV